MRVRITEAELKRCGVVVPKAKKRAATVQADPFVGRWSFTVSVPMVVKSEANLRQHWTAKQRRKNEQWTALLTAFVFSPWRLASALQMPLVVTMTHVGRRMDGDNLQSAFKGTRDWIAKTILAVDDGDPRVTWQYEQRPGKPGVELRIEHGKEDA